jgi:hypothetical protein
LARYINQPLIAGRTDVKQYSDATLLELIAPIAAIPIAPESNIHVTFRIRPNYTPKRYGNRRIDGSMLGGEFRPLPLHLPNVYKAPTHVEGHQVVPAERGHPGLALRVEQVLQMWGYDMSARDSADHNWVRVVHREHERYLVNVYSEQYMAGGPVLDSAGRIVAVVSMYSYKKGWHLAFYVASLNDLEWC